MNDVEKMDIFLKRMADAASRGYEVNSNMIYANLIRLGVRVVNSSEIEDRFDKWIEHFKGRENIKCFVDPRWSYFCQFTNRPAGEEEVDFSRNIKMYVPVDDMHIEIAAKKIFGFMADKNIYHLSKIGKRVRFDDIVIRLNSMRDAALVHNFITSDPYIVEGLMEHNPFAYSKDGISYAWDNRLSFNSVLSKYISAYINFKKEKNELDNVDYAQFYDYVKWLYNSVFVTGESREDYKRFMEIDTFDNPQELQELNNHRQVTEILLGSLAPDKNMNDFYKRYRELITDKERIWIESYAFLIEKYGKEHADSVIQEFKRTGNYAYFTRSNDTRFNIQNNDIDARYIDSINERKRAFEKAVLRTFEKYDMQQAVMAIAKSHSGDYSYITNDYDDRKYLKANFVLGEAYEMVRLTYVENGYKLEEIPDNPMEFYTQYVDMISKKGYNASRRVS